MHYILAATLIVAAAPAWADWVKYSETDQTVIYGDPATLQQEGDHRKVLQLLNSKKHDPDRPNPSKLTIEYDCKGKRSRMLSVKPYADQMANGAVVFEWDLPVAWKAIEPGVGETVFSIVCK